MDPIDGKIAVSIGVTAYNEEANIGRLLEALVHQRTRVAEISEIIVVSSGSTDATDRIVRDWSQRDPRIRLLQQRRRKGKAAAINLFLEQAQHDVVVLESGDTIPGPDTVERLIQPLLDPGVGMTGARPVPVNPRGTVLGRVVHLMWELHHRLALKAPKLGETVAFRRLVERIPPETAVDEATLEAMITRLGLRLVYVPTAIVHNKGPETVSDFLRQRRRIMAGHLWLRQEFGYTISTKGIKRILQELAKIVGEDFANLPAAVAAVVLEASGRLLGWVDYRLRRRNPYVWEMAMTTKDLGTSGREAASSGGPGV